MGLVKANDTIDRHGMWQMIRVFGVGKNVVSDAEFLCR